MEQGSNPSMFYLVMVNLGSQLGKTETCLGDDKTHLRCACEGSIFCTSSGVSSVLNVSSSTVT